MCRCITTPTDVAQLDNRDIAATEQEDDLREAAVNINSDIQVGHNIGCDIVTVAHRPVCRTRIV